MPGPAPSVPPETKRTFALSSCGTCVTVIVGFLPPFCPNCAASVEITGGLGLAMTSKILVSLPILAVITWRPGGNWPTNTLFFSSSVLGLSTASSICRDGGYPEISHTFADSLLLNWIRIFWW